MDHNDFKKIILARMHLTCKPHGFRKTGSLLAAEHDAAWLFVHLQSSRWTTRVTLVCTVNLGIALKMLAERQGLRPRPSWLESHWRERIGNFLAARQDKWWTVQNEREAHEASEEIANLLQDQCLPTMHSLATVHALRALWESGTSPGLTDYQRRTYLALLA